MGHMEDPPALDLQGDRPALTSILRMAEGTGSGPP
jgi:hypothetical protein